MAQGQKLCLEEAGDLVIRVKAAIQNMNIENITVLAKISEIREGAQALLSGGAIDFLIRALLIPENPFAELVRNILDNIYKFPEEGEQLTAYAIDVLIKTILISENISTKLAVRELVNISQDWRGAQLIVNNLLLHLSGAFVTRAARALCYISQSPQGLQPLLAANAVYHLALLQMGGGPAADIATITLENIYKAQIISAADGVADSVLAPSPRTFFDCDLREYSRSSLAGADSAIVLLQHPSPIP